MPPIISLEPSQRPNSRAMGMAVRDLETKLVRHAAPTPRRHETCQSIHLSHRKLHGRGSELGHRGDFLKACRVSSSRGTPCKPRSRRFAFGIPPELVENALDNEHARKLLTQSGFKDLSTEGVVSEIKRRIQAADASRATLDQTNCETAPAPKPEQFVPCCATGHHHDHGPNHVCQCRAKAALSREELRNHARRIDIPARDRAHSWLPSSRCGGIHRSKRRRVSRLRRVESVFGTAERP